VQIIGLLEALSDVSFDSVRRILPQLLVQSDNPQLILDTCHVLANDRSFIVRYALAESIPQFPHDTATAVARILSRDNHSRIRGFLAYNLAIHPYYFDVTGDLVDDLDWSVRASLASAVARATDLDRASSLCAKFISDGVWQVQLSALRSLTSILLNNPTFEFSIDLPTPQLMKISHIPLKTAVIDCFFALRGLTSESVSAFGGIVQSEPSEVKLHFVSTVASNPFLPAVVEIVTAIIGGLCKDSKWRIRLGIVSLLSPIVEKLQNPEIRETLGKLCVKMLDDEAFPVRDAAMAHIAKSLADEKEIPELVKTLEKTESFRKRQTAVGILEKMYTFVQTPVKELILTELRELQKDPISNVSYAAGQAIAVLSA
jgi:HEAT repeat protein